MSAKWTRVATSLAVSVMALLGAPTAWAVEVASSPFHPSVVSVLAVPDRLEVLSLMPDPEPKEPGFYGWNVLGRTVVKDSSRRATIVNALSRGIFEADGEALCFSPRHGVRAKRGKTTVDLVVCFECSKVEVYVDGKQVQALDIDDSPHELLDGVLRAAHVPLDGDTPEATTND
jgi:hypothetical protein